MPTLSVMETRWRHKVSDVTPPGTRTYRAPSEVEALKGENRRLLERIGALEKELRTEISYNSGNYRAARMIKVLEAE